MRYVLRKGKEEYTTKANIKASTLKSLYKKGYVTIEVIPMKVIEDYEDLIKYLGILAWKKCPVCMTKTYQIDHGYHDARRCLRCKNDV
jgi:predicted methyltransferase